VYLNFGRSGPNICSGNDGDSPSDPTAEDNQAHGLTSPTWSSSIRSERIQPSQRPEAEAKKLFYSARQILSTVRVIYDWLVKNNRLGSKKYLVGESYGGIVGADHTLPAGQLGVALNGVVLVSVFKSEHRRQCRSFAGHG